EIERDAALARVDAVVHRGPLPPALGRRLLRARETDAVRALDRLRLDDVGAEDGEEVAHEGTGPEHREVEHAEAGEGQGAAVPDRRRRLRGPPRRVLAESRCGCERTQRPPTEP